MKVFARCLEGETFPNEINLSHTKAGPRASALTATLTSRTASSPHCHQSSARFSCLMYWASL